MESLERSKAVIEVGKRIVDGLRLGDDVTAQWMAHLVAEKISAAENTCETDKNTVVVECMDLILKLWAYRYTLPQYMRPLRELDPLLNTLSSLGVTETSKFRFFERPPSDTELEGATEEEKKLFMFAIDIDQAARELIRYTLSIAAERSVNVVKPWLEDSLKSGLEATIEVEWHLSRFVAEGMLEYQEGINKQSILDRADQLESFANSALSLASEMREMLSQTSERSDA